MKGKFFFTSVMLAAVALWFNPAKAQKNESDKEIRGNLNVSSDRWDGSGETFINYVEDGHRYKIRLKDSKIVEMHLDGKRVADEDYSKYEPLVKKIMVQIEKDRAQAEKDRAQAERDRDQAERDREQADRDRQQADRDREQARKEREQAESQRQEVDIDRQQAERDRIQVDKDRKQAERDRAQAALDRQQADRDREQANRDREQAAIDRAQAEEDRKLFNAMIDELVKDNLLESREALTSLELDEEGLFINRKEQPESVYSRYKQKYLKRKNSRIYYRNSNGNRNLSFD